MKEITVAYESDTRILKVSDSDYAGTTIDNISVKLTVTGIPEGYSARLDFDVAVPIVGSKKKGNPYLRLDENGSCTLTRVIMAGCKTDLRLPIQLVMTKGDECIASQNKLVLNVSSAIDALGATMDIYEPDISHAFVDVTEDGGVITFTRLDGTTEEIRVNDDFVAWTDVLSSWPETPSDDNVPTAKAVDDNFVKKVQTAPDRLLITDEDGIVTDNGPRVVDSWTPNPSDDNMPTEKLVHDNIILKADDSAVVHNDVGTPVWDPDTSYHAGSTVVRDLEFYISQNDNNKGHDPKDELTVWWAKVTGSGAGGDDPGAYRVFSIGDGSSTEFIVNHQFNSYYVAHVLYTATGRMMDFDTTVERTSKNHIKISFRSAPDVNEFTLVAYRPGVGSESIVSSINGLSGDVIFDASDIDAVSTVAEQGLTSAEKQNARDNIGLGSASLKNVGTSEGQLVALNAQGKLPNGVIPAVAMTEYLGNVATKAQLVSLVGEQGDWATVSADTVLTNNGAWSLNGDPADIDDWIQIAGPGRVLSVNGAVGVVVLDADDVGAVAKRTEIEGDAKCKITFGADGLVLSGEDLAAGDIPNLPASKINSGTLNIARLPTGNAANKVLKLGGALLNGQSVLWDEASESFVPYTPSASELAMFTGTINGDGTTKVFSFSHGLGGIPVPTLIDGNGHVVSTTTETTATTLTIKFYSAPENGETYIVKAIA